MKSTYATFLSLVSVLTLLSLLSGCTLIGAQMGSNASLEADTLTGMQTSDLQKGRKISVSIKDGIQHFGIYKGLPFEPLTSYTDRYDTWFSAEEIPYGLPFPEETLTLTLKSGNVESGLFHGFDRDVIYIKTEQGLESVSMIEVILVTNHLEETCDGAVIVELNEKGSVPLRTVIALYQSDQIPSKTAGNRSTKKEGFTRLIDPNEVLSIHVERKSYVGSSMLAGFLADVLIISLSISLISMW